MGHWSKIADAIRSGEAGGVQEYSSLPVHERVRLGPCVGRLVGISLSGIGGIFGAICNSRSWVPKFSRPYADEDSMKPTCICGATDCCNVRETGHAFCAEHQYEEQAA